MEQHAITDTKSGREIRFEGELLGFDTTEDDTKPRWSEFSIYRTKGGQYITVKKGCSVIYHATRECAGQNAEERENLSREFIELDPCEKCTPADDADIYFEEIDLCTVFVSKQASEVLDTAYIVGPGGNRFIPHVASRALAEAADKDSDLAHGVRVQVVQ